MSIRGETENRKFRSPELRYPLLWAEFRDLLATFFTSRDLSGPAAWNFFKGMDAAFKKLKKLNFGNTGKGAQPIRKLVRAWPK